MAILSRVSQRALWLRRRRISSMPVSTGVEAEVPGKPRKHHGVRQSFWRRSTHQPPAARNHTAFKMIAAHHGACEASLAPQLLHQYWQ